MKTGTFIGKSSRIAFVAAIVALGSASAARAQDETIVVAKVPFAFIVGGVRMPAGDYAVRRTLGQQVLAIVNQDGHRSAFAITIPTSGEQTVLHSELVFKKFEGEYFLARVEPHDGESREIVLTPALMGREVARLHEASHTVDTP